MSIVIGVWFALAAGLAGLSGMRRSRRLRSSGQPAWAVAAVESPGGPARRILLQFALADGRVIERSCPQPARKATSPTPGQKVLIWYDPVDPLDVLVFGRDGRHADRAFVAAGCCSSSVAWQSPRSVTGLIRRCARQSGRV